jgi:hypothetical protein
MPAGNSCRDGVQLPEVVHGNVALDAVGLDALPGGDLLVLLLLPLLLLDLRLALLLLPLLLPLLLLCQLLLFQLHLLLGTDTRGVTDK